MVERQYEPPIYLAAVVLGVLAVLAALGEARLVAGPTVEIAAPTTLTVCALASLAWSLRTERYEGLRTELVVFFAVATLLSLLQALSALAVHGPIPASLDPNRSLVHYGPELLTHRSLTAAYVHSDAAHLVGNLHAFTLYAPTLYVLCTRLNGRRWFRHTAIGLLFVVPVLRSAWSVVYGTYAGSYTAHAGFSTVTAGFAGAIAVAFVVYVWSTVGRRATGALLTLLVPAASAGLLLSARGGLETFETTQPIWGLFLASVVAGLLAGVVALGAWFLLHRLTEATDADAHDHAGVAAIGSFVLVFAVLGLFTVDASVMWNLHWHGVAAIGGAVLCLLTWLYTARRDGKGISAPAAADRTEAS